MLFGVFFCNNRIKIHIKYNINIQNSWLSSSKTIWPLGNMKYVTNKACQYLVDSYGQINSTYKQQILSFRVLKKKLPGTKIWLRECQMKM